jgi:integrase
LLDSDVLEKWRNGLLKKMQPASVDRVCNAFRAALNYSAKRRKPPIPPTAWQLGLSKISSGGNSRNVVISDQEIRRVVAEAAKESPEFGLFVELAAVTGARVSQLARITVGGLRDSRVEIPSSFKGRRNSKKKSHEPVPIPMSLAARLREAARGKSSKAMLMTKPDGEPWNGSGNPDQSWPFRRAVARAGLDPAVVTINALRHSSITRQIKANVPIRIVAVMHDTSVAMIERTYTTAIAEQSESIVRPVLLDIGDQPASNVVRL